MLAGPPASAQSNEGSDRPNLEQIKERILREYPQADRDGNGELSQAELRAAMRLARELQAGREGAELTRDSDAPKPTHADVAYGEGERHRLDLFVPTDAKAPTPVVVFFHGGGFSTGDKSRVSVSLIRRMHAEGISVAAVNYRFVETDPLPAAMLDGARAVQYLRAHAAEWNLDPTRFGVAGGSAGAGIALWIALHDDLADAASDDPVARQSTRVTCAAVNQAQVSYDPRFWIKLGLDRGENHRDFGAMYGFPGETNYDNPQLAAVMDASAPITFLTADDPPMRLDYTVPDVVNDDTPMNALIHHPRQGLALQDACKPLGVACEVYYPDGPKADQQSHAFFTKHLKAGL